MRRSLWLGLLLGGCAVDATGTGTLAYVEAATGHLRAVDVASGDDTVIDPAGRFGSIAISADAHHIAYVDTGDGVVRVADLPGGVTTLAPPSADTGSTRCFLGPTWGPKGSLTYCIVDGQFERIAFMPGKDQPVRTFATDELAISPDASTIVYHRRGSDPSQLGDVVAENADGTNQRVLQASTIDTTFAFAPDGLHVAATMEDPAGFHVVVLGVADGTVTDLGTGSMPSAIRGGSIFSPDGTEVLTVLGSELVAIDPVTGARRHFADVTADVSVAEAAFIERDRVIYHRSQSSSLGGDVVQTIDSFRISNGSSEINITSTNGPCFVDAISPSAGFVAASCTISS